ncbi:MAG: DUF2796 domain-containing protein [Gammaproteobacteria bacterium]|nr:DUF2796 domain-containing protein [Gammaproteobacteria bacterium]
MTYRTAVGALALIVGHGAVAAETHGAHEHGHAVLKLVQEGMKVLVHFQSPLDSIVGFEHEPENDEQRTALEEAMRTVQVAENIVRLPAVCTLDGESEVNVPYLGDNDGDDHADDHDAADEHSDTAHAEHESIEDGDDHDADEHAEVHADLEATFKYRCENGIEWLEATALATFGGLEEVELQAVGSDAAIVESLTPESPRAALTGF